MSTNYCGMHTLTHSETQDATWQAAKSWWQCGILTASIMQRLWKAEESTFFFLHIRTPHVANLSLANSLFISVTTAQELNMNQSGHQEHLMFRQLNSVKSDRITHSFKESNTSKHLKHIGEFIGEQFIYFSCSLEAWNLCHLVSLSSTQTPMHTVKHVITKEQRLMVAQQLYAVLTDESCWRH